MITVINYGMGNSGSIMNMLRRIGAEGVLTSDVDEIARAEKLVLPGVGAFDQGMERLDSLGLIPILNEKVLGQGTPILGICLGVQLLGLSSEEGTAPGLGWINARSHRFTCDSADANLRIPHMGWNVIRLRKPNPVVCDLADDARFYFVHSYHVRCHDPADILASSHYGIEFTAAVARGAIMGVQFHPEKSLRWGMEIFRKFAQHAPAPGIAHATSTANHSLPAAAQHRAGQDGDVQGSDLPG